jgi:GTPase SAR1 family protein
MRIPGALFGGDSADLDWLYREWSLNNTKEVRVLDFIGYDKITKSYVFNDYAVSNGKVIPVNKESFFQLKKSGIKTSVDIKQTLSEKPSVNWHDDFKVAFGTKGIITLAWWLGSLFAEQVREQHRSYPFFELIGEASSGKSSLVDFLWKLLGKDSETFNPNTSTPAGRQRKMAEVANIPIAFNETDNENEGRNSHAKRFNWDELKDLFEGEFGRVTGIKSQDNTTKKPKFKSTLIIVQNIPVVASEAILSRIVHTNFDRSHHSEQGYEASIRLNSLEIDAVNGFLLKTLRQEPQIMQCFNQQFSLHRRKLEANKNIKLPRIVDTHAKIMAFADCLAELMPSFKTDINEVHKELASMAEERQQALNQDTQLVQQFWSMVEYLDTRTVFKTSHYKQASTEDGLDDDQPENSPPTENAVNSSSQLNHSTKPQQEWAINIEHFIQQCGIHNLSRFNTEELRELRRQLPSSKKYKFEGNKPVRSRIEGRTVRCYVFSKTTTK